MSLLGECCCFDQTVGKFELTKTEEEEEAARRRLNDGQEHKEPGGLCTLRLSK